MVLNRTGGIGLRGLRVNSMANQVMGKLGERMHASA